MASMEPLTRTERSNDSGNSSGGNSRDETVMIARQPIFDRNAAVCGYELLFRSSVENSYRCSDPRFASVHTICRGLHSIGLQAITGTRRAFINFTMELLLEEMYTILPKDRCVIEVLETTVADEQAVQACKKLREAGYQLALDDVVEPSSEGRLLELADYIKLDFRALPSERRWVRSSSPKRLRPRRNSSRPSTAAASWPRDISFASPN
jgi:c-di-GMP-related signal transduction protein